MHRFDRISVHNPSSSSQTRFARYLERTSSLTGVMTMDQTDYKLTSNDRHRLRSGSFFSYALWDCSLKHPPCSSHGMTWNIIDCNSKLSAEDSLTDAVIEKSWRCDHLKSRYRRDTSSGIEVLNLSWWWFLELVIFFLRHLSIFRVLVSPFLTECQRDFLPPRPSPVLDLDITFVEFFYVSVLI